MRFTLSEKTADPLIRIIKGEPFVEVDAAVARALGKVAKETNAFFIARERSVKKTYLVPEKGGRSPRIVSRDKKNGKVVIEF